MIIKLLIELVERSSPQIPIRLVQKGDISALRKGNFMPFFVDQYRTSCRRS